MNKLFTWIKRSGLTLVAVFVLAKFAFAIDTPQVLAGSGWTDLGKSIGTIYNVVILISSIIFVILFLVGGIMYLTAMGNPEQSEKSRKLLIDAVVGLVIVLAAWAIGSWVLNTISPVPIESVSAS